MDMIFLVEIAGNGLLLAVLYGLVSFLLGALFGYSLNSKYKRQVVELERDRVRLNSNISNLESDLEAAKKARSNADGEISILRNQLRDRDSRIREVEGKMSLIEKKFEEASAKIEGKEDNTTSSKTEADLPVDDQKTAEETKGIGSEISEENVSFISSKPIKAFKNITSNEDEKGKTKSKSKKSKSKKSDKSEDENSTKKKSEVKLKRGRPKKAEAKTKKASKEEITGKAPEPKKRRGRPKGSKNKTTKELPTKASPTGKTKRNPTDKVNPTPAKTMKRAAGTGRRGRTPDDLKIIEGIGPKMEEALRNAGVKTFRKMSTMTPEAIKDILVKTNTRYGIAQTDTWPEQAKLASLKDFEALKTLQDSLNRGVK